MAATYLRRLTPSTHAAVSTSHISDDRRLSWRAVGILTYMLTRPDNWEIRRGDIVNRHTEGRDAVATAIRELRECGYVRTVPRPGGGKDWVVSELPLNNLEWESELGRTTENPSDGKSGALSTPQGVSTPIVPNGDLFGWGLDSDTHPRADGRRKWSHHRDYTEDFEEVWGLHRRGGKRAAFKAYLKAVPDKVSHVDLALSLMQYVDSLRDGFQGANLSTFINQEYWEQDFGNPGPSGPPELGRIR